MAGQLSAIGALGASIGRVLPGAAKRGLAALGNGLEFAGHLEHSLQGAVEGGSALAQLATALQSGAPIASIATHVAADLSGALLKATGNSGDTQKQQTLQRGLASALAPPGTSPPQAGGAAQAAALQQRLTELLTTLTRETNTAGQQSEFSGTLLDAETAKEIPAQQQTNGATASAKSVAAAAISSFVQTLIARAAASVSASNAAAPQSAATPANAQTPANTQTPVSMPMPAAQVPSSVLQSPALPDILTRILSRATNAQAQQDTSETVARALAAVSGPGHSPSTASPTPSNAALFERLIAIVAEQQAESQTNANTGGKEQNSNAQGQPAQTNLPSGATFSVQTGGAPAQAQLPQTQPTASTYTTVDPQAVIDQIVKGISVRDSGTTSEVRLQLQPANLGDVSLKLTVTGNTVSANVIAQNPDVRDMLLSNQQHLSRSLSEAGLSLGKFSVNVSGGNAGFTGEQSAQQSAGRSIAVGGSLLGSEDETTKDQPFGPPLIPGSGSLVFNYLA
jgi:Flagellar hook-length control protein FliK